MPAYTMEIERREWRRNTSSIPYGEVRLADGAAGEMGGEDGFNRVEGVEPFYEGFGWLGVFEALVEAVAKSGRKVCGFAVASHGAGCAPNPSKQEKWGVR
jgi:hypothetical protein